MYTNQIQVSLTGISKSLSGNTHHPQRSITWNGLVLLWGPPGTGKTSLCKALAQRLSIRLKTLYFMTTFLEVDANSLYSKYYSESAKIIEKTFQGISQMIASQPQTLHCILIDEIETLATSRSESLGSNEPKDSMRVCLFSSAIKDGAKDHE